MIYLHPQIKYKLIKNKKKSKNKLQLMIKTVLNKQI